ncbi:P-loop containing nucleoside triphosphate hydrolase protein [Scenedesmus sp. NREL 46B-D3]|nr:P-loop containing nucleoside triphosphate hydrolase protein [Scenedesmus sp. NREL 46B-D3]
MADDIKAVDFSGIQVCVRARPLNDRERDGGFRNCISFDEATQQVVLSAVDRNTLVQLRGQTAKGYAFDRRFSPEHTSDNIYDDCVCHLVDNLFKGYNATVLAYGQTGSGKTLTMSGGQGIFGNSETGIIRRAAQHILAHVEAVQAKLKPGESITVRAYALELYNEELRDLSGKVQQQGAAAAAAGAQDVEGGVRIAERSVGKDGRCVPEVVGVTTVEVADANSLVNFFAECFDNRAVAATKMNDRSSRSHAIYTVLINRTLVDVSEVGDKVRTMRVESRFNLVDLAGSERVKRSGVTGRQPAASAAFKEAVHINGGLLALGNVIVALSGGHEDGPEAAEGDRSAVLNTGGSVAARSSAKKHIPYRDSKLTRLLQDSLGGSALTVLISCISSCEADFEETNSTLKYANRACRIRNSPLPNKQLLLEEDLLPLLPANAAAGGGSMSMIQMQHRHRAFDAAFIDPGHAGHMLGVSDEMLLAEHNKMKEAREKREVEKKDKDEKRLAELRALREAETKAPGFQRLRMAQYDELRKKLVSSHGGKLVKGEAAPVISDDTLAGFKKRTASEGEGALPEGGPDGRPHCPRPSSAGAGRWRLAPAPPPSALRASRPAMSSMVQRTAAAKQQSMQRRQSHSAAYTVLAFKQPEADAELLQLQQGAEAAEEQELALVPPPQLLARFRVNQSDTLAVFRAVSAEDFADVASLLPPNTALPAADKMTYLLARLEVRSYTSEQLCSALDAVACGAASIGGVVGPAVGCLMATFGTSLITDCIFDFEDPEQLAEVGLQQRLELWGLQLLRRWLQSGVKMKQVSPPTKLIYPPSAHDYTYYKSSTVAYFLVDEVKESLGKVQVVKCWCLHTCCSCMRSLYKSIPQPELPQSHGQLAVGRLLIRCIYQSQPQLGHCSQQQLVQLLQLAMADRHDVGRTGSATSTALSGIATAQLQWETVTGNWHQPQPINHSQSPGNVLTCKPAKDVVHKQHQEVANTTLQPQYGTGRVDL